MNHIKQGYNECFPTVLAMLSGTDVNKIMADAKVLSPTRHSWAVATSSSDIEETSLVFNALARKYAPYLMGAVGAVNAVKLAEQKRFMSYADYAAKTRSGKGAVLLCSTIVDMPSAHIVAFENGEIFDGNLEGPISARDFWLYNYHQTKQCPYAVVPEREI